MHNLNEQLFFLINRVAEQNHLLDVIFIFISNTFVKIIAAFSILWFALVPFAIKNPVRRLQGFGRFWLFISSILLMRAVVEVMKMIVAFPRPQEMLSGVHALSTFGGLDSFPSAHTAFVFTVATFVYHYSKPTGVVLFLAAILVGVSRIFVGVHFPVDVIIGAGIGMLVPWVLISIFKPSNV